MQRYIPKLPELHAGIDADAMIGLDEDGRAVALRHLGMIAMAGNTLRRSVVNPQETVDMRFASTALRSIEGNLADLSKALRVPLETQAEVEQRNAALRAAHQRVQQLEDEMARRSTHGIAFGLKGLEEGFRRWWRREGLGSVSEVTFFSYGMQAKLSGMLFGRLSLLDSDTPVSDDKSYSRWLDSLGARGFVICRSPVPNRDQDCEIVDCDATRQALRALLAAALPSCEIRSITSHDIKGLMALRNIDILVRDLDEIALLDPAPPREDEQ